MPTASRPACADPWEKAAAERYGLPVEPYALVRKQLRNLLRLVNEKRLEVGLEKVGPEVLRYRRRIVQPFEIDPTSSFYEKHPNTTAISLIPRAAWQLAEIEAWFGELCELLAGVASAGGGVAALG